MKLALIAKAVVLSEIQRKYPITNLDRSSVTGALGSPSVNDLFRIHPNKGFRHPKPKGQKRHV